jgi:hypothetical protein
MAAYSPGWYPDQRNPDQERWWDGTAWSEHVRQRTPSLDARPAETRSSTPNTMEVKASTPKEGLLGKAWSHAVMTGVGIIATALATGMVGERKQQEIKREGGQALLKSQEIISELLTHQKEAQAELAACRAGAPRSAPPAGGPSAETSPTPRPPTAAMPEVTLDGSWVTPDRTVVWEIQGNRAAIRSVGQLSGFVDGSADLRLEGSEVTGTLTAATYYGMMQGTATVRGTVQGDYINGTIQDQSGQPQPLVLVRSK